eukprot:m.15250 g.15250  ORF g.15250 m.15250 type:complete len:591 (+) comp4446_c0_seq1:221-1993(+)
MTSMKKSVKGKGQLFVALDAYTASAKGELSFEKGTAVKKLKAAKGDEAWFFAQNPATKKKGFVPANLFAVEGALELNDWCHGAISRNGAEYLLREHDIEGMYLVRESQSQPGQYTLDIWKDKKAVHYRISLNDKGYFFRQGVEFPSITELIDHHQETADGLCMRLGLIAPKAHAKTIVIGMDLDKKWELKREAIKLGERLGVGNYGEVYKAEYQGKEVAVKTIKEDSMETEEFMKEAHVMKKLMHPNLVKLIGVCSAELPMYIVQEFVPHGDLLTYLRKKKSSIDVVAQLYMAFQAADGMSALEAQNVIHRDLAARNCLVGDNLVVKIADFGMGRVVDDIYTARTGTKMPIKWTAPEALCYDAFSTKSDVWSFGILLWEISTYGDVPYPSMEARDVIHKLEDGYRMEEPSNCPDGLYAVMCDCWEMTPQNRPTFGQLKLTLEELHIASKGDAPERKAAPPQPSTDWRKDFEEKSKEKKVDIPKDVLTVMIEHTKEVFSIAQKIYRYPNDASIGELVQAMLSPLQELLVEIKNAKGLKMDKSEVKNLAAAAKELMKAKGKVEKIKSASEKIREIVRVMNKDFKQRAIAADE